jgi:hypothetical protein
MPDLDGEWNIFTHLILWSRIPSWKFVRKNKDIMVHSGRFGKNFNVSNNHNFHSDSTNPLSLVVAIFGIRFYSDGNFVHAS